MISPILPGLPAAAGAADPGDEQHLRLSGLTTEHQADRLGVDATAPRLGWILTSARHGVRQ